MDNLDYLKLEAARAIALMSGNKKDIDALINYKRSLVEKKFAEDKQFFDALGFESRKEKKLQPSDNLYGYRWVSDSKGIVYIVKIQVLGEYWLDKYASNLLDYVTDKCLICDIKSLIDNNHVQAIENATAYWENKADYKVGNCIDNQDTWFCLSEADLFASQGQTINRRAKREIVTHTSWK